MATSGTNGQQDDGRGITFAFALFRLGLWSFFATVVLILDRTGEPTRETATA